MQSRIGGSVRTSLAASLIVVIALLARSVALAGPVICDDDAGEHIQPGSSATNLEVTGTCAVPAGTYVYRNVNIYTAPGATMGGTLTFADAKIDFYTENIIVEGGGKLIAGSTETPIGTSGGQLTIHLWGAKTDPGATCVSTNCGVPNPVWTSNMPSPTLRPTADCTPMSLPGNVSDCFYQYQALDPADTTAGIPAYYGHKVLAVGYNGTIQLFGAKGATYAGRETGCLDSDPSCSGTSWTRLNANALPKATSITVDGMLDWKEGDQVIITSTDFMPSHAEVLTLSADAAPSGGSTTLTFATTPIKWPHNGMKFDLSSNAFPGIQRLGLNITSADTRASVGLLSERSIRIVSEGDTLPQTVDPSTTTFPPPSSGYFYGGHTLVRQGFLLYQVQGVEFYQLGQGGDIMHYPVHFHMDRQTIPTGGTAPVSFVKDCSIWDSMTRWIVIHATQGVKLARNVGYQSIGHGYYLEDGTETGNQLYSNLGVLARGAVRNAQNPRSVPGILTTEDTSCPAHNITCTSGYDNFPFYSDANHPSVFWIMNGMNDFQYNMAAGASTCGACYWFVPGAISGLSLRQKWYGYASEQLGKDPTTIPSFTDRAGTTPLQNFLGNSCSSAMEAFMEVGNSAVCQGVNQIKYENLNENQQKKTLQMLWSTQATSKYPPDPGSDTYWPIVSGGGRLTTLCSAASTNPKADCSAVAKCSDATKANCDVVVLDKFTTDFNWPQNNFSAIWVRPFWSLVIDSVIGDPLGAGLNFVTSGDYSKASVITGFWALARKSAFIGSTQWQNQQNPALAANPYASNAGPFNPFKSSLVEGGQNTLSCSDNLAGARNNQYCMSQDDGISIQLTSFGTFQRLFSVYDGPTYQDSNAYVNIHPTYLTSDGTVKGSVLTATGRKCMPLDFDGNPCSFTTFMNAGLSGYRAYRDPDKKTDNDRCYFPNAAIGWKQPNGFYYAPAFHSVNLFFSGVDIRHFVTEPLFQKGTLDFKTDLAETKKQWCSWNDQFFTGFTDIDRETVLNDDDGTLTGLTSANGVATPTPTATPTPAPVETFSINNEHFFDAPIETTECASDVAANKTANAKCPPATARTSPYGYLTAAIYPECGLSVPLPPPGPQPPLRQCADGSWGTTGSQPPTPSDPTVPGSVGVPIYRQLINAGEAVGENQVKRMMGQNNFQRSGLTVDNGMYYIDTNLSKKQQTDAGAKSLNTFVANGVYDLYFVYAKANSKQTYLMYVGKKLPENFAATNVKFGYVDITTDTYRFAAANGGTLPAKWSSKYTPSTGILRLVMDMSGLPDDFDLTKFNPNVKPPTSLGQTLCQPATMCMWNNTSGCTCNPASPYASLCNQKNPLGQTVCSWSVKDLDCPIRGCPSFQITFPSNFEADGTNQRPVTFNSPPPPAAPDLVRFSEDPNFKWNVPYFLPPSSISGADCNYTQQPGSGSCMTSQ
jgi:G8 domain